MNIRRYFKPILAGAAGALLIGIAVAAPYGKGEPRAVARPAAQSAPNRASWCAERCDSVVTDWSLTAYHVIKAGDGYQDPMAASRSLAMMHIAMHDAVNSVSPRYQTYALSRPKPETAANAAVAAIVAAHDVLAALYPQPAAQALLQTELQKSLFDAGIGPEITSGTQLGKAAAAATLAKRSEDGSTRKEQYVLRSQPGQYRFTPPFDFAAAPHWRQVTPFAIGSPSQYRSQPPPALGSDEYKRDFDEVKRLGAKRASARTRDEEHYAKFWYEFSDIGWNRVARISSSQVRQDLWERARTFALLNMAMADSYIAGWEAKYHYNTWRPVTAIQRAADDGNPGTTADSKFETLLPTPPVPDLPSTHSVLGMAAATVLAHGLGRDQLQFSFASPSADPDNPVRSFSSFSEAARENGESRIRAGLHFRFAVTAGLEMGKHIGEHVTHHALKRRE
jgi:hypothetical protein